MDDHKEAGDPERIHEMPHLADALESERMRQFLDHVPVAIAVSELLPSEAITYANLEFERLTGCGAADIQGQNWRALPGISSKDDDSESLSHAVSTGEEYVGRFNILLPERSVEVDAWSNTIQSDEGHDMFRLVALAEVSDERMGREEQTRRQLRDKDALLHELQHRVKNNLQMITALIRMEARNLDQETGKRFDRLAGRISALAILYDLLSSQDQHGAETIDLGVFLSRIASAVMQAHAVEGMRLDMTVDTWPVSINVAMPAGLVVNELMTNALKHAFTGRDGGTIKLHSLINDEGCRITIEDDGVGLPPGATWPKPGKLGAVIVQSLRQNAKATLEVHSEPGHGLAVTLFFARNAAL